MLLTLTTTQQPATDLGYLLFKNPARVNSFKLTFGAGTVFWPEASEDRATAALWVEVDPVSLSRQTTRDDARPLEPYVNDRPYTASSFLATAIAEIYGSALSGRCEARPELASGPIPLEIGLPVLACRGGEKLLRELFEPLGYTVEASRLSMGSLGDGVHFAVTLRGLVKLSDALAHLCVLVPVLDHAKHYWVGSDEVDKLLRRGGDWLPTHPARELITRRYLKYRPNLAKAALAQLAPEDFTPEEEPRATPAAEEALEEGLDLNTTRLAAVHAALRESGAKRVMDLGCGDGKLTRRLVEDRRFEHVLAMDVSAQCVEITARRLRWDRMGPEERARLSLLHGSLVYRDARLEGYDAAAVVEVVEHLDPWRLDAFAEALFAAARPRTVVLTTPNREYNALYPNLADGRMRHGDHRFEWSRAEFEGWAAEVAERHRYTVVFQAVGEVHPELGAPTQMGVFTRCD